MRYVARLTKLLPVLLALSEACLSSLSSVKSIRFTPKQSPVDVLEISVWTPPTMRASFLLALSADGHCLFSIRRVAACLHCQYWSSGKLAEMGMLDEATETKWKMLMVYLPSKSLNSEIIVCMIYSENLKTCMKSCKEGGISLNYASFDFYLSVDIPTNSLEIKTNQRNWQENLSQSNIPSSLSISPFINEEVFLCSLNNTGETVKLGFVSSSSPRYIAVMVRLFLSQSIVLFRLCLQSECTIEGILTYTQTEGLRACAKLPSSQLACSSWVYAVAHTRAQVILLLSVARVSLMSRNPDLAAIASYDWVAEKSRAGEEGKLQASPFFRSSNSLHPRSLTTEHYSLLTYTGYVGYRAYQFFTFYNTHTATTSIHVNVAPTTGDPDIALAKDYAGFFDYYTTRTIMVYPADTQIVSKGGIIGLFTVVVYGYTASNFVLTIKITCTQTSADCYCPAGQFPDPTTTTCAACPENSTLCNHFRTQGCLPMTPSTSYVNGSFYCTQCSVGLQFDTSTGACRCYLSCATCQGLEASDCLTCKANSVLDGLAPNTCSCRQGYFPNVSASQCSACNSACYSCSSTQSTGCTACYLGATLTSVAPSSCQCDVGYGGAVNACFPCYINCQTCFGPLATQCLTCVGGSPSSCLCPSGSWPNPDVANCSACAPECGSCTNGLSSGCTSCFANAQLVSTAPCSCQCKSHYYGSVLACAPCHAHCRTCSGPAANQCLTCFGHSALTGTSPNSCACLLGYWPNPDVANCYGCNSQCLSCSNGTSSGCLSCKPHATLIGVVPNSCQCDAGYVWRLDQCTLCDATCDSCSGPAANQCLTCFGHSALTGTSPNSCACLLGYWPNPDVANCYGCNSQCLSCSNGTSSGCLSCNPHATLMDVAPYSCQCDVGYGGPVSACVLCAINCQTCAGSSSRQCLTCAGFNSTLVGTPPNSCMCLPGYWPDPDTTKCSVCASECFACVSASNSACTLCQAHAHLFNPAPSACTCDSHYYYDSTICAACHPTCKECLNGAEDMCTECEDLASLELVAPSTCKCDFGTFPMPDTSNCQLCSPSCLTCSSGGPNQCLSCAPNAYLQRVSPSTCVCLLGWFPNPSASQCSPCTPTCQTCSTELNCLSCKSNAELHDKTCNCVSTFMGSPDASNCVSCPLGCANCTMEKCVSCSSGFFMYENECMSTCPSGFVKPSDGTKCEVAHYPTAQLIVQLNNSLTVEFDKPMNATLYWQDISVTVTSLDQLSVEWTAPLFITNQILLVDLHFEKEYIPNDTAVLLTFNAPDKVVDFQNLAIEEAWLSGVLFAVGSPPSNTSSLLQSALAQQTTAVATGGVAANMVSSVFSGNPTSLLATFSQFQLISYLALSPVPLYDNFAGALAAMNVNSMIPNPLIGLLTRNYSSQTSSATAAKIGLETTLLLPNIVSLASISLLLLLSYVPLKLGATLRLGFLSIYCANALYAFKWSVPLSIGTTMYLDLGVYSLLQVMNNSFEDFYLSFNTLCAYAMIGCFVAAPVLVVLFIVKNKYKLSTRCDDSFNQDWSMFFTSFSSSKPFAGPLYYFLFYIRRFAMVVTLFTLPPGIFALLYFSMSLSVLPTQVFLYVLTRRPFAYWFDNAQAFAAEGGTVAVAVLVSVFTLDVSEAVKETADVAGVWVVRVILIASSVLSVVKLVLELAKAIWKYKQTAEKLRVASVHP